MPIILYHYRQKESTYYEDLGAFNEAKETGDLNNMEPCVAYEGIEVMEQCCAYEERAKKENTGESEAQYYTVMNDGPIYQDITSY